MTTNPSKGSYTFLFQEVSYAHISNKGYIINIKDDPDPSDPRTEFANITNMFCCHKRYKLGDERVSDAYSRGSYNSWDEMEADIIKQEKVAVILPLYLYDHSGITIRTTPFSCRWDSGQIGFVWITKEQAKKDLGIKYFTKKALQKVTEAIKAEVSLYDDFLTGNVYGYEIVKPDNTDNVLESCWGYYGYESNEDKWEVFQEAKSVVDYLIQKAEKPLTTTTPLSLPTE